MEAVIQKIGFMQGRLSPVIDGKIQSFPWGNWEDEFSIANNCNFHLMEWTLDQHDLYKNPLLNIEGSQKILKLCADFKITVPSLTGDCFMQSPFWKLNGEIVQNLKLDFLKIIEACGYLGIELIVVPLVDNGKLENAEQETILTDWMLESSDYISSHNIKIILESDFGPQELAAFIENFPCEQFGINYDIGNSAFAGFSPFEELSCYGDRVLNVHIKDRIFGGSTVPLGSGSADFVRVFSLLKDLGYEGNYILQTARAEDGNHSRVLADYRSMVLDWLSV